MFSSFAKTMIYREAGKLARHFHGSSINMALTKKFIYASPFKGKPTVSNFKLVEEEIGETRHGEILCQAEYLSVDPYMRAYMFRYPVGTTMIGGQIARVIQSKNVNYPVGALVHGNFGWKTLTVVDPDKDMGTNNFGTPYILPDFGDLSPSLGLGVLGMPGNTAYFGFLEICKPKAGETTVVSTAGGAVGSLVGQIAKIKGCKVIGLTGSDRKVEWLKNELGFDNAFNYKIVNISSALKEAAPLGIDTYFDNVGGDISSSVISRMRLGGRIAVCGAITAYNSSTSEIPKASILQPSFVFNQLKMEGFLVHRWADRWMEGITQMFEWIKEGKIKYEETTTEGFENMPQAFLDLLEGGNKGKAVIKV